jgi:hypothetical protein
MHYIDPMPRRRDLNGLPHDMTQSFFSTLRYDGKGYVADNLFNAAKVLGIRTVKLDILNVSVEPVEVGNIFLLKELKSLKGMMEIVVQHKGWSYDFIEVAVMKIAIPDPALYAKTFYCYTTLIDRDGKTYDSGKVIISANEQPYNPLLPTAKGSLWNKIKSRFR